MGERAALIDIGARSAERGFAGLGRSAEHGFVFLRRSAEHGFTLIEMLVALAVFSLAALALLRLEGATLASTAALDDKLVGQIVARNLAVETLTDPLAPTLGVSEGDSENAGRTWHWTRSSTAAGEGAIIRVDIAVTDDARQPVAALTIVRPAS